MFVLYAFLISVVFAAVSTLCIKTFQLENYRVGKYVFKVFRFQFAIGRKTPLVCTNRVKRLFFCIFLLFFCIFLLFFGLIANFWVNFLLVFLLLIFLPLVDILAFWLLEPFEKMIKLRYIKKAKRKLSISGCQIVAITGSFGKTSTKNILTQILKKEFRVCASPRSFNTPMGICKTILEDLKETDEFLILEFGARHVGDIDELCKITGVDFGMLTPLGNCHLETFGSLENLENTKFELCQHSKKFVVFSGKNLSGQKLFERFCGKKFLVGVENSFAFAKDIKLTSEGSLFTLVLDGEEHSVRTQLLGEANIDNIVEASAMAYLLGMSDVDIASAIADLKPTPHRLEMIRGFANVIDDAYNSNFDGFQNALNVLKSFKGRKIVVSPGIVELGRQQYETNLKIGKEVGDVADIFLIMNETNKDALTEGCISSDGNKCEILYAKSREEQKQILAKVIRAGDAVLFENDLPDNIR